MLLSARQGWARVLTPAPPPLPADSVTVSGQDLVPLAGALGVAALATLAAVIATRGLARRLTGVLLAAFGVAIAVAVSLPVTAAEVLAAARVTTVSQAGSATAGGAGRGFARRGARRHDAGSDRHRARHDADGALAARCRGGRAGRRRGRAAGGLAGRRMAGHVQQVRAATGAGPPGCPPTARRCGRR